MPPKARVPAPIDRPLSKAYLREFSGWSTAFPPGLSDPTSLRKMENVQINRDGSARIRPGLRYLSYDDVAWDGDTGFGIAEECVGTHEAFFLNDGSKAYLFAVRENDGTVGFRVLVLAGAHPAVRHLTHASVGFSVPQTEAVLNFTAATTYVKYLQIDNKIFALSNAGETMRYFTVGATKVAKRLSSIERPNWDLVDKLTVVEPDSTWIAAPSATRKNLLLNPSFETNALNWTPSSLTALTASATVAGKDGAQAGRLESLPSRTNLVKQPLHQTAVYGITGWTYTSGSVSATLVSNYLKITAAASSLDRIYYGYSPTALDVVAGQSYKVAWDIEQTQNNDYCGMSVRWYNSAGATISDSVTTISGAPTIGRKTSAALTAPAGAVTARLLPWAAGKGGLACSFGINDVVLCKSTEATTIFDGDSGANYLWSGAANASASLYHPPVDVTITSTKMPVTAALDYSASAYVRAGSTVRNGQVKINWYNASSALLSTISSVAAADTSDWLTRYTKSGAAPATATQAEVVLTVAAVPRGEYHYVDAAMLEQAAAAGTYFDGDTTDTLTVINTWDGTAHGSASTQTTYSAAASIPAAETKTAATLISSTGTANAYNFGYFYTFSNEIGESAASQVTVIRAQRAWPAWKWETPNASGEPSGTLTSNPDLCADQLVAYMPQAVYDAAKAQGAISWSLYMLTWSDQDSVPIEGILLDTQAITTGGSYNQEGWIRHSPQVTNTGFSGQLPNENNRYNYSKPSSAAQGIVASDRMVLVDDPVSPAVIRWSSNQQGEYTNFTAAKGGGYKTLTSGNLYIAAAAKLWQNPQSVDTLTILCLGIDGMSTGYYMAPATVSSQSEQTNVMGFEETTATPGTTSPYGCEVLNNALYHPLDDQLMKSTATNYNINHKSQTDQIDVEWARLTNKHRIISSIHDGRIYFIVHNPLGAELEAGCMGNELWVFDAMATSGTWSRWTIQAHSLRKVEFGGQIYMSVIRPDGIYYLDPFYDRDDLADPIDTHIYTAFIPWLMETNTQGANRAHDAWARLQQVSMSLGNFQGSIRWGIRSYDLNGKAVEISKITKDLNPPSADQLPFDIDDHLLVRRDLKEWFLFAESVVDDLGDTMLSFGQIDYVQYRYTPVTVNVGYEYGEVETFEYGRALVQATDRTTDNGVPQPFVDTRRP